MMERCLLFGEERHLVGMLCQPAPERLCEQTPGVLLWNAGPLHRVGPHRLHVELARRLAAEGIPSLRFDLSGLGDSAPRRGGAVTRERAVRDVREAMDGMTQRLGTSRFVLVGLCSGADEAHRAALADPRVGGVVLIDGYMYATLRSRLRFVLGFLGSRSRIANLAGRLRRRVRPGGSGSDAGAGAEDAFAWTLPPRREAEQDLQTLIDRDMALLFVFTGEYHRHYNYAGQFYDMYPRLNPRGRVAAHWFADDDHTFSRLAGRARLIDAIVGWIVGWGAQAEATGS